MNVHASPRLQNCKLCSFVAVTGTYRYVRQFHGCRIFSTSGCGDGCRFSGWGQVSATISCTFFASEGSYSNNVRKRAVIRAYNIAFEYIQDRDTEHEIVRMKARRSGCTSDRVVGAFLVPVTHAQDVMKRVSQIFEEGDLLL